MLTTDDKEEIRRLIVDTVNATGHSPAAVRDDAPIDSIVNITARAIEVFGTREKALRWLKTPVRSLGDRTPLSLLETAAGLSQVEDTLGRVEHGVW